MTVGELLDRADATLGERFREQPLVEASVRMALAMSYETVAEFDRAEQNTARAFQIRERHLGPEHPSTLEALDLHAWILATEGWDFQLEKPRAAEPIARRALSARRRVLGATHIDTISSQTHLGMILSNLGRQDEAEPLLAQAAALGTQELGAEHEVTLLAWHYLAVVLKRQGNLGRAEALLRQVLENSERSLGPLHQETLYGLQDLVRVLGLQGRAEEARRLQLETVNRFAQVYGLCHIRTSAQVGHIFTLLKEERNYPAIRDLCERWIREILAAPPGVDQYERKRRSVRLSGLALNLATLPEPVPFDAALAVRAAEESAALNGDWDGAWTVVGVVYYRTGQIDKAMRIIQTSMARPRRKGGDDFDWLVLALIHARRGETDEVRIWYDKARNRKDPVGFERDELRPLREEAAALLGVRPQ